MRTKVLVRSAGLRLGSLLLALAPAAPSVAATLEVSVVDEQGQPIEDVAVYATPASGVAKHVVATAATANAATGPKAIMDQHDMQFVPHLLVVQAGTEVTF